MYFWKYILAKKAGLSQKKCNMALYGLPVLPIAEAFEKTVTGNPISVTDALAQDALSLQVAFTPTQDGTPSIDSEPTTEPYLSKVVPRGNKEYYSLVGGTVAWNQKVQTTDFVSVTYGGITGTNNGDGTYTVNGRARDLFGVYRNYELTANHVYFAMGCPQGGNPYTYRLAFASKTDIGSGLIYKSEYGGNETLAIRISNGTEVNNLVFRPQLIDLTLMFANNPAIANYVYTLEQSEAGSGIAWLKSYGFFTKDYYPYNAGELISVNTSGHKTVGFNQWDEQWEVGRISTSTGANIDSTSAIRSKNFCKIMPNTTYYVKSAKNLIVDVYDENKAFIQWVIWGNENRTITTPSNAAYFKLCTAENTGNTYANDICINISDPQKNGTYKPYVTNTYPLGNDELRGVYKLSNGKFYANGDIKTSDGTITRHYKETAFSNDTQWQEGTYAFYVVLLDMAVRTANVCVEGYIYYQKETTSNMPSDGFITGAGAGIAIWFNKTGFADLAAFKAHMNGRKVVYELTTPTTESATPYTSPIDVEEGGTEEFIDNRTVPIPVGNETYYASEYAVHGKTGVTVSHGATEDDPNPTEYEVEFTQQGTVYGGTVDIVTGVLTVTWAILSNPQNLNWISNSSQGMKNFQTESGTVSKKSGSDNWKCSRYSNGFIGTDKAEGIFIFNSGEVCIRDYRYWEYGGTSAETAAFKASLADVTIAYELATPLTYQLTAQQVQMLLGDNYLVTEDGTITLTYMAGR